MSLQYLGNEMVDSPFAPQNQLPAGLEMPQVAEHAQMNFSIAETPALMLGPDGLLRGVPNRKTLYREDTLEPLSLVGGGYKVVQPLEMLEFYSSLIEAAGYQMASAGVLQGGRRYWAMARTGSEGGLKDDPLVGYLFLGTAIDGSMATTGFFTTQAMTCWNMAPAIVKNAQQDEAFLRVPHSREFKLDEVQQSLGQGAIAFDGFVENARQLAEKTLTELELRRYLATVFRPERVIDENGDLIDDTELLAVVDNKRIQKAISLFNGEGRGMGLGVRKGTAWGAYNAVTEYLDHYAPSRSIENRFHSTVLGEGLRIKHRAMDQALLLAS